MGNAFAPLMPRSVSTGLLFVRIVVGLGFIFHGLPKILNATDWMGNHLLTVPWNGAVLGPIPDWLQALVAAVEFFGGIAVLFGFLTRLAAIALCVDMIVAFLFAELPHGTPFVGAGHTLEPNLTYLVVSFMLLLAGPGAASLDATLFGPRVNVAPRADVQKAA